MIYFVCCIYMLRDRITQSFATLPCACSLYHVNIIVIYKVHSLNEAETKYKQTETSCPSACIKPLYLCKL